MSVAVAPSPLDLSSADDATVARAIAQEAGDLLLAIREGGDCHGKALGDRGDARANALILARLRQWRPQDCVLSEESADDLARCAHQRVWIIDPLDGTREYAERREDWAVHIGLSIGGVAAVGAVALPGMRRIFVTDDVMPPPAPGAERATRPRMIVSRSRPPAVALAVAQAIGAELVELGSAGAKAMAVVAGEAEIYLHAGGQYQWDNCAPVAVAAAAGLHTSRLDGSPLIYNDAERLLPDLLICAAPLAASVLAAASRAVHAGT